MHVLQRLRHAPIGFNMTPMIDVVFLLIIFFLVSSHLAQRENRIQVDLPTAHGGQLDLPSESPRVTITLQRSGEIWLAGRKYPVDQIADALTQHVQQHGAALELRIRCDRELPYREVEPVLSNAAKVGLWNVTFSVIESAESRS